MIIFSTVPIVLFLVLAPASFGSPFGAGALATTIAIAIAIAVAIIICWTVVAVPAPFLSCTPVAQLLQLGENVVHLLVHLAEDREIHYMCFKHGHRFFNSIPVATDIQLSAFSIQPSIDDACELLDPLESSVSTTADPTEHRWINQLWIHLLYEFHLTSGLLDGIHRVS